MKQSRVRVGSGGPKCCVTPASPGRTAQRQSYPSPNQQQDMRPNFKHVQAPQGWSLGLCAGNGERCYAVT